MKNIFTVLLLLFSFSVFGQLTITESLFSLRKKYNPLFKSETSVLTMDFTKSYTVGNTDTSYFFIVKVNKTDIEIESLSVGTAILGSDLGAGSSIDLSITESEGQINMNRTEFKQFYDCASAAYTFVSGKRVFAQDKVNTTAKCNIGDITIIGEYYPRKVTDYGDLRFYFQIGEAATYNMKQSEFEEIMGALLGIEKRWQELNNE